MIRKLDKAGNLSILVIGDVMLDVFVHGNIQRLSPETDAPVLDVEKKIFIPGGAANVANNLQSLGAQTFLIGAIGRDDSGDHLHSLLKNILGDNAHLIRTDKLTTKKSRIINAGNQILRIDEEDTSPLSVSTNNTIFRIWEGILSSQKIDGIILQDYDKGFFDKEIIKKIITSSKSKNIPLFVDPKFNHFMEYTGVTLFKPNKKELLQAFSGNDNDDIFALARKARKKLEAKFLVVTLSGEGMLLVDQTETKSIKTTPIDNADVSGAGDTSIAMMTLAHLLGYPIEKALHLSNIAAGIVCQKKGVSVVSVEEIINALKRK